MEKYTPSHNKSQVSRDHIVLDLGHANFYISIVEERDEYYHRKELALVFYKRASSLLGQDTRSCVCLSEWYDPLIDEITLQIEYGDQPEAIVVATAITRALAFINTYNETMNGDK